MSVDLAKQCAQVGENDSVDLELMSSIEQIFKSLASINGSFLTENNAHLGCSSRNPGVSIVNAENAFEFIRKMENKNLKEVVSIII